MSSDAEILAPRDRLGEVGLSLNTGFQLGNSVGIAPAARRGHSAGAAAVSECGGSSITITRGIITMASTQESTRPIPLIGQAVGQAQASLTRILIGILAESGTSYQTYLGLQRLTALGGEATRDAYERDLSDWLELDGTAAARLADDLAAAGLAAAEGGAIRLTAQGRGLREGVLAASAKITGPVLATIDRGDLETTVRTLDEITRRARGIPARRATTEDNR
jgi:hypothetical protein